MRARTGPRRGLARTPGRTAAVLFLLALLAGSVTAQTGALTDDPGLLDATHTATRYAPFEEVWWSASLGESSFLDASPVLAEDKVVVADWSGAVVALDAVTGKEAWRHEMASRISSTPTVALGRVFVADTAGTLVALDADTGAVLEAASVGATRAPITFHEGKIFLGTEAGEMVAFTATTLDELWRFDVTTVQTGFQAGNATVSGVCEGDFHPAKPVRTAAAVHGGVVVFGAMNHHVYAVDEMGEPDGTTTPQWIYRTGDIVLADPVVDVARDRVLVAGYDETIRALPLLPGGAGGNACHGTINAPVWSTVVAGSVTQTKIHSRPALAADRVFFGANNGNVYAYDAAAGGLLWSAATDGPVLSDPAVANGVVVVGSDDGFVHWFSATNGTLLSRFEAGSPVKTGPLVSGNNTLLASETGIVYRLGGPPPARPDLVVSDVRQTPTGIEVTVANQGTGTSGATDVRVEHNGTVQGTLPVPELGAGESTALFLPFTVPPGLQTILATVDADGGVQEQSDTNNAFEGTLFGVDASAIENATVQAPDGGGPGWLLWLWIGLGVVAVGGGGGFAWWWFRGRYEWVDEDEDEEFEDEWE